jgi:NAD(P)H-dependent FMN reductase
MKLLVIVGSTRPGRIGRTVAEWFMTEAKRHGGFEPELVDLKELDLPFLDEPDHPAMRNYTQAHTKAWSAQVAAADAYVFVTSEYNHGYPAPLKNALDYLNFEWRRKPAAFVGYGGIAAGARAVEQLREVASELHLADIRDAVLIPFVNSAFDENGKPVEPERLGKQSDLLLDDLVWWAQALKLAREDASVGREKTGTRS